MQLYANKRTQKWRCTTQGTPPRTKNGPLVQTLGAKQQVRESAPHPPSPCAEQEDKPSISGDVRRFRVGELSFGFGREWVSVHTHSTAYVVPRIASGLFMGRVSTDHCVHQAS